MVFKKVFFNWITLCVIVLIICEGFGLDLFIQDLLFVNKTWMVEGNPYDMFIYKGPKVVVVALGIISIILAFMYKQKKALCFLLCITLIPLTVAFLKQTTCIYCPRQTIRYGGLFPYLNMLQSYLFFFTNNVQKGVCFPAAHASCGFSLLIVPFLCKKYKTLVFCIVFVFASLMAFYQMARGQHYLSHSLITMIIAFKISKEISKKFNN